MAARCAYFHSMFSSNMKESKQSVFQVEENVSKATFLLLIEYLYTDSFPEGFNKATSLVYLIDNSFETLQAVLVLANQYNVTRLCEICEQQIEPFVTYANAIEILLFAEVFNFSKFKV